MSAIMAGGGAAQRAAALLGLGRHAQAEAVVRQGLAQDPHDFLLLSQLARSLIGQDKAKEALVAAQGLVAQRPDSDVAHRLVAIAYVKLHRGRLAEESARQAVELDPEDGWNHYALAAALMAGLRLGRARACARRAVELDPEEADFHLLVGKLHRFGFARRGRGAAREAYAEALRLEPENAEALRGAAEAGATATGFARTVVGLRQSLELDPTDPKPAYDVLAGELRRVLFWLRVLAVAVFLALVFTEGGHGIDPVLGRLGVLALLAAGSGFLFRTGSQLSAPDGRLVWRALRRKPGLMAIAASVTLFFAASLLWALTGADWMEKPVIWSWIPVFAGIVFRYYWNLLRLPFVLLWLLALKLRAWSPVWRNSAPRPKI
ncbi:MAG: tetratricopeptide repeat protein [Segniliparus sp.]|uniref:tetratricopeptide repeat protein n=1 Tax=Segniliparus sp. TaxID=2804064 RepID=UPI003F3453B9